jgi:hypothetical protein
MKIRVTLEVTDDARRCIAANAIREAKAKGQLVAESKFTTGKSWLLKQAALMEGVKLTLWEEPLLRTQPATQVENPQPGA